VIFTAVKYNFQDFEPACAEAFLGVQLIGFDDSILAPDTIFILTQRFVFFV
jgi:hypothetical protein